MLTSISVRAGARQEQEKAVAAVRRAAARRGISDVQLRLAPLDVAPATTGFYTIDSGNTVYLDYKRIDDACDSDKPMAP